MQQDACVDSESNQLDVPAHTSPSDLEERCPMRGLLVIGFHLVQQATRSRELVDAVVGVLCRCTARSHEGASRAAKAECKQGACGVALPATAGERISTRGRPDGGRGGGAAWLCPVFPYLLRVLSFFLFVVVRAPYFLRGFSRCLDLDSFFCGVWALRAVDAVDS